MELTTLKYFVTVAKELHFRRAAARLNITQAPLSAAIKKLEDELEVQLFERTSRSVKLTAAGTLFLAEAEAVLQRTETALTRMADLRSGSTGQLSIGYNETALNTFLPQLLSTLRNGFGNIQFELRELETAEQLNFLRDGTIDIGFMRPYGFDLTGLEHRLIWRESYVLVMPEDHELAAKNTISAADLSGKSVILFARDVNPMIYDRITISLSTGQLPSPHFRQDARNKSSMLALAAAGFGAALLPESSTRELHRDLVSRPLDIPLPPVEIMAVWNPERTSRVLHKILDCLPGKTR
ncbi:MAG: LysR family transcriptional regulator [Lentisphaerae bacterium]|nr:LysR family transcriptional regulator [Lentisphaerota bacterium]